MPILNCYEHGSEIARAKYNCKIALWDYGDKWYMADIELGEWYRTHEGGKLHSGNLIQLQLQQYIKMQHQAALLHL